MPSDEHALLLRVGSGDRDAFRALVAWLSAPALALAGRITQNRDLAEEAAQEAFVDVWLKSSRYDPGRGGVRQWILTMVHHKAVDAVRRERSAARMTPPPAAPRSVTDDPEEMGIAADRRMRVGLALAELSPRQREAIELAYFGGLTYRQVAERLQIPEGTAKSRLRDGLLTLRGLLETHGVELGA